jgi:NAD(P)H:quinone oxidoreductase type IV
MSSKIPLVYVIYYSTYGHIEQLAWHQMKGLARAGVDTRLFQIAETLSPEIVRKMHGYTKPTDVPAITAEAMPKADGFLFGMPTRFGTTPAQVKSLFDACGRLWANGSLQGKYAGTFFSTASLGSGQETTALSCLPFFAHLGMVYVPIGYKFGRLSDLSAVHGGKNGFVPG